MFDSTNIECRKDAYRLKRIERLGRLLDSHKICLIFTDHENHAKVKIKP